MMQVVNSTCAMEGACAKPVSSRSEMGAWQPANPSCTAPAATWAMSHHKLPAAGSLHMAQPSEFAHRSSSKSRRQTPLPLSSLWPRLQIQYVTRTNATGMGICHPTGAVPSYLAVLCRQPFSCSILPSCTFHSQAAHSPLQVAGPGRCLAASRPAAA